MADRHIKSADTSVSVSRSVAELERILVRYGCAEFGFTQTYGKGGRGPGSARVTFVVSDEPDQEPTIPVELRIDVGQVERAMTAAGYAMKDGQARRVAFRNLVLWVDSACSSAAVGLRPMSEAFFADLVVTDPESGQSRRMHEIAAPHMQRGLLTAGDAE